MKAHLAAAQLLKDVRPEQDKTSEPAGEQPNWPWQHSCGAATSDLKADVVRGAGRRAGSEGVRALCMASISAYVALHHLASSIYTPVHPQRQQ